MTGGTILAAVDFSPDSERGARLAAELAARWGRSLSLVHAAEPPMLATVMVEPMFVPPQWLEALRARHDHEVDGKLALLEERLRDERPGLPIERHIHLGDPAAGIADAARERDARLIVVATRGAGASRFLLGSVTAKVAQQAPCPVLVADRRDQAEAISRYPRVMAAVDFSELSRPVARLAGRFTEPGGVLEVCHVWHEPRLGWLRGHPERDEVEAHGLDVARRRLAHFIGDVGLGHPRVESWAGPGNPAAALLDRAEQTAADLVVLGAHGRHGAARALGTVADRVLRHASCALLILPAVAAGDALDDLTAPRPGGRP